MRDVDLPVYFGNRNWEPYVEDTVAAMRDNGIRRAAVFATSAWGGYSGCTQYVEDIAQGPAAAGERRAGAGQTAPVLRPSAVRGDVHRRHRARRRRPCRDGARLVFTAHSIPVCGRDPVAAQTSTSGRWPMLAGLVAAAAGYDDYDQVWQSRSGPPQVPWLEPDVADHLARWPKAAPRR